MKRSKERAWRAERAWRLTARAIWRALDRKRKSKNLSANAQARVKRGNRILEHERAKLIARLIQEGQRERAGRLLLSWRGVKSTPGFMRLVAALLDGKEAKKTSGGKRAEDAKAVLKAFNKARRGKQREPTYDEFEAEFRRPFNWVFKLAAEGHDVEVPKIPTERSLRRTVARLGLYFTEVKPGPKS